MGLPPVAIGFLTFVMSPAQAAALVVVPQFVTNIWQMTIGPGLYQALKRFWSLQAGVCFGTWVGSELIRPGETRIPAAVLGITLALYSTLILASVQVAVPRRVERWLSPFIGAATGVILGVTGILIVPLVPYIQALDLSKEELLQVLGISFVVAAIALGAMLARADILQISVATGSLLALLPSAAGMLIGRWMLQRVSPDTFRIIFLWGLLALGSSITFRAIFQ